MAAPGVYGCRIFDREEFDSNPSGDAEVSSGPGIQIQTVELYRQYANLSVQELWWLYFQLGGMNTAPQFDALLHGRVDPSAHEYNLMAAALNEHFMEFDPSRFILYAEDGFASN
jgi:hypothetical protein